MTKQAKHIDVMSPIITAKTDLVSINIMHLYSNNKRTVSPS